MQGKQLWLHPIFGSDTNLLLGAKVAECSNQHFARAENITSPLRPRFDPTLFGQQGKVMDSWESGRHNVIEFDSAVFELRQPVSHIKSIIVSTEYHNGNHGEFVGIDVRNKGSQEWTVMLPKNQLRGHSMHVFGVQCPIDDVTHVRVRNYPDGGITRVGLFETRNFHT